MGPLLRVTNLNDSGPGSLREAVAQGGWIVFDVDGDIRLASDLHIPSNVTIDGRGRRVRITWGGFVISGSQNVIVTNLLFADGRGGDYNDAISIRDSSHTVWIHRCSLRNYGDGLIDITLQATDVTVSWCRFDDHEKVMLIGSDPNRIGDQVIRVTLHHSYFRKTGRRHPRLRLGKCHAYNNFVEEWEQQGMVSTQRGELVSEHNIFEAASHKEAIRKRKSDPRNGFVTTWGDLFLRGAFAKNNPSTFDPRNHYAYTLDPADQALRRRLVTEAGWR
jgi:pectate lyase